MRQLMGAAFSFALVLVAAPLFAQTKPADDMQAMVQKVKTDRKAFVATNMQLTDAEGKGFWPVYDAYQQDMLKINERLYKLIEAYAKAYKSNSLTDGQATTLVNESLAIEEAETKLKKSYVPRLAKVLPAKKVARYLQVENKIRAQVRYELALEIPLAQ